MGVSRASIVIPFESGRVVASSFAHKNSVVRTRSRQQRPLTRFPLSAGKTTTNRDPISRPEFRLFFIKAKYKHKNRDTIVLESMRHRSSQYMKVDDEFKCSTLLRSREKRRESIHCATSLHTHPTESKYSSQIQSRISPNKDIYFRPQITVR